MSELYLITGNEGKHREASSVMNGYDIEISRMKVPVVEVQPDDGRVETVAAAKAISAYEQVAQRLGRSANFGVIVNDAGWDIKGLNGFPGPYMAQVNEWFREEDWRRLTESLPDRAVQLTEAVSFYDGSTEQTVSDFCLGHILDGPRGISGAPSDKFIVLSESGFTISEEADRGIEPPAYTEVWEQFAKWYTNRNQV